MTWTVTKENRAVSFSNWLAQEAAAVATQELPLVQAFRSHPPVSLRLATLDEPDPFETQSPAAEPLPSHGVELFLGQSRSIYEDLLNRLPMMIQVLDGNGIIQSTNKATADALGYAPDELIGREALSLLTRASRAKLADEVLPAFNDSGHFADVDVQFLTKDGRAADFLMSAIGYRNGRGRIERWIAVFTDMSARARAVAALGQSEQRFRTSFEAAPHGMAVVTADGRLETVNEALADMLGLTAGELAGRRLSDIVEADDLAKVEGLLEKLAAGANQGHPCRTRLPAADDRHVFGLTSISAVRDEAGRITQYIIQIVDITSRQKAEAHLRQAQKMEAIGQLTGGIAHDFNNLLTVVIGNLQLVESALKGNAAAEKRAREAIEAATKGSQLTKQLLAFARRQSLVSEEIKVNQLIAGMGELLKRSVGEAVEVKLDLMDGDPTVVADPTQLETSVLNLAINARDAMANGGRLTIETTPVYLDDYYAASHDEVVPGPYIMIAVSDTGTGIPKHLLHKVFQPFFTTKEVGKGTGLGLSMVFGFIKQSGGHVKVYSEEGCGTSIKMYLPRKLAAGEVLEAPTAGGEGAAKAKILVVEDQEAVRAVAVEFLIEFGYEVLEAENAVQALQILQDHKNIDLLFTDVVMPGGMNGFDLSQAASLIRPDLKIIHASGYPKGAMVHQEEPRLRDNLISKPYHRDELRRIIEDTLSGKGRFAK